MPTWASPHATLTEVSDDDSAQGAESTSGNGAVGAPVAPFHTPPHEPAAVTGTFRPRTSPRNEDRGVPGIVSQKLYPEVPSPLELNYAKHQRKPIGTMPVDPGDPFYASQKKNLIRLREGLNSHSMSSLCPKSESSVGPGDSLFTSSVSGQSYSTSRASYSQRTSKNRAVRRRVPHSKGGVSSQQAGIAMSKGSGVAGHERGEKGGNAFGQANLSSPSLPPMSDVLKFNIPLANPGQGRSPRPARRRG